MSVKLSKSRYWTCLSKKGLPCLLVSCLWFLSLTGKLDEVLLFCLSFALQAFPCYTGAENFIFNSDFVKICWSFLIYEKIPSISCCSSCPFWLSLSFLFPALHSPVMGSRWQGSHGEGGSSGQKLMCDKWAILWGATYMYGTIWKCFWHIGQLYYPKLSSSLFIHFLCLSTWNSVQSIPRDCMHLDTRRCIAGQTTADGEEEEGMGRRIGWGGDGGEDREGRRESGRGERERGRRREGCRGEET